jgi:DNA invertase Pin-like site-specific DNA recombinase
VRSTLQKRRKTVQHESRGVNMASDDVDKRIEAVRSVRSQRAAAERAIPGERLRREIREAFERQDARDRADDAIPDREPDEGHRPDA